MPRTIDTPGVGKMVADGAQLVEVLPKDAFDREHLPGAISLPLSEMTEERAASVLARSRPVIVYCCDLECDLSPRVATWLETLGFDDVYDYAASKGCVAGVRLAVRRNDQAWLARRGPRDARSAPTDAAVRAHHPRGTLAPRRPRIPRHHLRSRSGHGRVVSLAMWSAWSPACWGRRPLACSIPMPV